MVSVTKSNISSFLNLARLQGYHSSVGGFSAVIHLVQGTNFLVSEHSVEQMDNRKGVLPRYNKQLETVLVIFSSLVKLSKKCTEEIDNDQLQQFKIVNLFFKQSRNCSI